MSAEPNSAHALPSNPQIEEDKRRMRAAIRTLRDALTPDERMAEERACHARLLQLPALQKARVVLMYMSFGSEMDTHALLDTLVASGKRVASPRVDAVANSLVLQEVQSHQALEAGVWGILQPKPEAVTLAIDEVDFVLLPGLAFDRQGGRLGYGAGYYDRLLAASTSRNVGVTYAAMAFTCQIVDCVPTVSHDVSIDTIITPREVIHCARAH
jgi:5-formyltetrahydrofolate cyclo-ligase